MNKTLIPNSRQLIYGLAIIFAFFENQFAAQPIDNQVDKLLRIEYYRLLELVQDSPPPQKIIVLADFLESRDNFEEIYLHLFDQYLLSDMLGDAENYFKLRLSREKDQSNCLWMLAKIYSAQSRNDLAANAYLDALNRPSPSLALLEDATDFFYRQDQVSKLKNLRLSDFNNNFLAGLMETKKCNYQQALPIFEDLLEQNSQESRIQFYCGLCHFKSGNFDKALHFWQNSLNTSRLQGDLWHEAFLLVNLGRLFCAEGNLQQSQHFFELAQKIIDRIDDFRLQEFVIGNRAFLDLRENNFQLAISRFEKAARLSLSLHEHTHAAEWFLGKGRAMFSADSLNSVLPCFDLSEDYARRAGNKELFVQLKLERGKFYRHLNLTDFANHEFSNAVDESKKIDLPALQKATLTQHAEVLILEKQYERAREIYFKILNDAQTQGTQTDRFHWLIGETYRFQDSLIAAEEHFTRAQHIATQHNNFTEVALANLRLGDVQRELDNYDSAIHFYNEALLTDFAEQNWELEIELNLGMGKAYHGKNDLDRAIMFYNRAANIIEENREKLLAAQFRMGYFSKGANVYESLIQAYFERSRLKQDNATRERLFHCMEMSRARVLRDLKMKGAERGRTTAEYQRACTEVERIQRYLRLHPQAADSLKTEFEAARYNLINRRLTLVNDANARNRDNTITLNDIRKGLEDTDFGLLFYHISEYRSFVLVVNQEEIAVVPLDADESTLASSVDSLISPFSNVTFGSIQETGFRADIAHQLYTTLIQPVEAKVALKNNLIIIPDFPLTRLPFELLLTAPPQSATYFPSGKNDYSENLLLNRYSFIYSPSTWLLDQAAVAPQPGSGILILANPMTDSYPSYALTGNSSQSGWCTDLLLFADEEAQNIKREHRNVKIFHRNTATADSLFAHAANYQIIHFATHAFVDTAFDAFSGLVLALGPDSTDDGLLMGYEIADMHLPCDLVTLSACETARGKMLAGEGVLGLPRLFLGAGAKNVLMTHWKVDDKFTSKLMPRFYDFLLTKNLSKSEALKQAQLSLIRETNEGSQSNYQHPVYWASFVLYGMPDISADYFTRNGKIYSTMFFVFGLALLLGLYFRFAQKRSSKTY